VRASAITPFTTSSPARAPACHKCHGRLRTYQRSGLILEQCEDCRGIFLDSGELERLIDAEGGGWSGRIGAPWSAASHAADGEPVSAGRQDTELGGNGPRPATGARGGADGRGARHGTPGRGQSPGRSAIPVNEPSGSRRIRRTSSTQAGSIGP
jgi:hypothetical protein